MRNKYQKQLKMLEVKLIQAKKRLFKILMFEMQMLENLPIKKSDKKSAQYEKIRSNIKEIQKQLKSHIKDAQTLCANLLLLQQPVACDLKFILESLYEIQFLQFQFSILKQNLALIKTIHQEENIILIQNLYHAIAKKETIKARKLIDTIQTTLKKDSNKQSQEYTLLHIVWNLEIFYQQNF